MMEILVQCQNCDIYWKRVVPYGGIVLDWDIQLNCPKCGSNWYEPVDGKVVKRIKEAG